MKTNAIPFLNQVFGRNTQINLWDYDLRFIFIGLRSAELFYRTTIFCMAQQAVFKFINPGAKLAAGLALKSEPQPATVSTYFSSKF